MISFKKLFISSLLLVSNLSFSQKEYTFEEFQQHVLNNHPIVSKARNLALIGKNEKLIAKGSFDPSINTSIDSKNFNGTNYFWQSNTALKIPTRTGINIKSGYEENRGSYLNPSSYTPSSGLWYLGVEVPILKGLFFDERRMQLKQAQNLEWMGVNEQKLVINDLLLDAYSSYNSWVEAHKKYIIAKEGKELAQIRYNGVVREVKSGDKRNIDTIEALIFLENRTIEEIQAKNTFQNMRLLVQSYLWSDSLSDIEIPDFIIPKQVSLLTDLESDYFPLDSLLVLQQYEYKLDQLELELRWKKEQIKPTLNLNYNLLTQPSNNSISPLLSQNYKYGITGYIPLFLRKERGGIKQTKLKIENVSFEISQKRREFEQKINATRNDIKNLQTTLETQLRLVEHAKKLRDSELTLFEAGESSLFLINSREQNYLNYKNKQVEIEIKLRLNQLKLKWLVNQLY